MTHYEASFYDIDQTLMNNSYLFEADDIVYALVIASAHISTMPHRDQIASVTIEMYEDNNNLPEAA